MDYSDDGQFEAFSSTMSEERIPCSICGRCFNPNALNRHMPICQKNANKQRKAFDSSKQRAEGTEIATVPKSKARKEIPAKKGNWRAKHQDFINTIKAARGVTAAINAGGPLPPPPPPTINPDYEQCPFCERRFNCSAAERHIPFCKEQHARKQITSKKQEASSRMKTRNQYKPPKPKARGSATATATATVNSSSGGKRYGAATNKNATTNMRNSRSLNSMSPGYGDGFDSYDGSVSPGNGAALRTGRTPEFYSDARDVGAKAKVEALTKKYPSNDSIHKSSYNSSKYNRYASPSPEPLRRPPSGSRPSRGESGYHSEESRSAGGRTRASSGVSRFCHDCGTKYPVSAAKFCCECGVKRLVF